MAEEIASLMFEIQKQLERVDIRTNVGISTLAKLGNAKLVEKFLMESILLKLSVPNNSDIERSRKDIFQNHFYTCCFWGFRDIVKRLLVLANSENIDFDLNAQNRETLFTPLHAATFQENGPVVMLLLDHGANPDICESDGWTPTHFASVSDKIWSHFAARGIQRFSMKSLLEIGLISRLPELPSRVNSAKNSGPCGRLVDYDSRSSTPVSSDASMLSAFDGDVLADDGGKKSGQRTF